MASEDPSNMFADMKKKKKKPKVAFSEETQVADVESREPIDDPSLGPATAHERALQSNNGDVLSPSNDAGGEDDVKAMFGDLKKKKKKKEIPADLDGETADAPPAGEDFSDIKKKKKKKEIPLDADEAPAAAEDGADDFADLKKKKKKKSEIPLDLEEGEGAPTDDFSDLKKKKKKKTDIPMDLEVAPEAGEGEDFGELKKKKKKKAYAMDEFAKEMGDEEEAPKPKKAPKRERAVVDSDDEEGDDDANADDGQFDDIGVDEEDDDLGENPFAAGGGGGGPRDESEAWLSSDRDYTYEELLSRFFRLLHAANPSLASSSGKRYTLAPPQIHREGNKKSVFANIVDICRRMHREPTHVISFLLVEMGTTGSTDGAGRLVIKGKFQQKQIENILRRYIMEYVTCKTCKSPDTLLTRETRISFMTCSSCGSRQSVAPIKAGFQAQVGKRKKLQV